MESNEPSQYDPHSDLRSRRVFLEKVRETRNEHVIKSSTDDAVSKQSHKLNSVTQIAAAAAAVARRITAH